MEGKNCFDELCFTESSGAASGLMSLDLSPAMVKNHRAFSGRDGEAREFVPCLLFSIAFGSK